MTREFIPPENCPVCGEDVPRGAKACPGCGADERAGWDEAATRCDGLNFPDETFTEETASSARRKHSRGLWIVVAVGLLVLLIYGLIFR